MLLLKVRTCAIQQPLKMPSPHSASVLGGGPVRRVEMLDSHWFIRGWTDTTWSSKEGVDTWSGKGLCAEDQPGSNLCAEWGKTWDFVSGPYHHIPWSLVHLTLLII